MMRIQVGLRSGFRYSVLIRPVHKNGKAWVGIQPALFQIRSKS